MLIWCSAAFFPQNQKHNWKKKFYLLSLFLLPRILKHYSQYTRAMCRVYFFYIIFSFSEWKGELFKFVDITQACCIVLVIPLHFTFSTTAIFVHAAHILCKSTYTDENFCGNLFHSLMSDALIIFSRCQTHAHHK